eukprot:scaffold312006_cov41-Tisochrysis_lutea.AAC.1
MFILRPQKRARALKNSEDSGLHTIGATSTATRCCTTTRPSSIPIALAFPPSQCLKASSHQYRLQGLRFSSPRLVTYGTRRCP